MKKIILWFFKERIKDAFRSAITQRHILAWNETNDVVDHGWDNLIMGHAEAFKKRHPDLSDEEIANY